MTSVDIGSGLGIAGLIIGVPGLIQSCIAFGTYISEKIDDSRNAPIIALEFKHKFKTLWNNLLDIFGSLIVIRTRFGFQFEQEITDNLEILKTHLRRAIEEGSKVSLFTPERNTDVTRLVWTKATLDNLFERCQEWESLITKRLIVILISKALNGEQLSNSKGLEIFGLQATTLLPPDFGSFDLPSLEFDSPVLPFSRIHHFVPNSGRSPSYLAELRKYGRGNSSTEVSIQRNSMVETAKMLYKANPERMNILHCRGYFEKTSPFTQFTFIYEIPSYLFKPRSLRELLISFISNTSRTMHPLDQTIRVANKLATAVLYIHSAQHFVHKNIKPENIIIFNTDPTHGFPRTLGHPFLVGFSHSRPEQAESNRIIDLKMADCIYQHPERWGEKAPEKFNMLHDIYSLGVVLLEIGIWKSFVHLTSNNIRKVCAEGLLHLMEDGRYLKRGVGPKAVQAWFVDIAKEELPQIMGQSYTDVVLACLSSNIVDRDVEVDEVKARMGIGYINHVVSKLEKIHV